MSYLFAVKYPQICEQLQKRGFDAAHRFERLKTIEKTTSFFTHDFCFIVSPTLFLPLTETIVISSDTSCVRWGTAEFAALGDTRYACFSGDINIALQEKPNPCTFLDLFCITPLK